MIIKSNDTTIKFAMNEGMRARASSVTTLSGDPVVEVPIENEEEEEVAAVDEDVDTDEAEEAGDDEEGGGTEDVVVVDGDVRLRGGSHVAPLAVTHCASEHNVPAAHPNVSISPLTHLQREHPSQTKSPFAYGPQEPLPPLLPPEIEPPPAVPVSPDVSVLPLKYPFGQGPLNGPQSIIWNESMSQCPEPASSEHKVWKVTWSRSK